LHQLKAVAYRGAKINQLSNYIDRNSINIDFRLGQSWTIFDDIGRKIKEKIEISGIHLGKLKIKMCRGILTGYNDAFIIDSVGRVKILDKCSSDTERTKTASIMRPVLRGRNINRGSYNWGGEYLIVTHNGYTTEDGDHIAPVDINEYPALKKHLDIYFEQLSTRTDKGKTPYNLRNCAYMEDFQKSKIIWKMISSTPSFAYTDEDILILNTSFMMTGDVSTGLADILNSKLIEWYFSEIATSIGETGMLYIKSSVENIPIQYNIENRRYSEDEIFKLYGLNNDEISYILDSLSNNC
jgi:hypothetical protein